MDLPDPPGFLVGARYALPAGQVGVYLGLATYEVSRIGMHAGARRYVWTDPASKVRAVVGGPIVFRLIVRVAGAVRMGAIVGVRRDELPAVPEEVRDAQV